MYPGALLRLARDAAVPTSWCLLGSLGYKEACLPERDLQPRSARQYSHERKNTTSIPPTKFSLRTNARRHGIRRQQVGHLRRYAGAHPGQGEHLQHDPGPQGKPLQPQYAYSFLSRPHFTQEWDTYKSFIDTSEQSKQHSAEVIDSMGGDVNHISGEDKPHSKNAAEQLEGSCVV